MFQQFLREEDGQTTVEYLLIIAVIVVTISVLGKGMKEKITGLVDTIFKGVNDQVKKMMTAAGSN